MPTSTRKRPASARPVRPPTKKLRLSNTARKNLIITSRQETQVADDDDSASEEELLDEKDHDVQPSIGHSLGPLGVKNAHTAQRLLTQQRRAAKRHSALLADAKRAWSLARQKRASHIASLVEIVRGKIQDIVFKHDASRIVQTIVKRGDRRQRSEVASELQGCFKKLAEDRYSKFLVLRLARHCPSHRLPMIMEFRSHVPRLLLHREASQVIAEIYELHTNSAERAILLRDFYGREAALLPLTLSSEDTTKDVRGGLPVVLQGASEDQRRRILASLKENLDLMFNNPEKGPIRHAIVHRALREYLTEIARITNDGEREKMYSGIYESCKDSLAEMVHTRDGSRVVREFLARGTAKDRKHIVKILKPYIATMATDEEAQLVLFTAFDVIDDTKLVAKSILPSITENAKSLQTSAAGRRTLLYPIVPRHRRHYTPAMISTISETDDLRAHTSKKSSDLRTAEICAAASPELLSWIVRDGAEVSRDTGGSLVITEIMLEAHGDKGAAIEALLSPLETDYPSEGSPHPIDLPHTSRLYKILLQGGHFSHDTKAIESRPNFEPSAFATAFLRHVTPANITAMAQGGGGFVIAALIERVLANGTPEECKLLNRCLAELKAEVEGRQMKGSSVLTEGIGLLGLKVGNGDK
ncbi:ARM repeat-containing protein [Lactarius akahatsu]|uniref:ARM repeat-containing protein n=1 Tax=Lactarius akahatsu TaxID=416441 RepID=A0AAD4LBF0_9AGAM|nr:ARM repeat-containing protein [Lactarius akahatsu]